MLRRPIPDPFAELISSRLRVLGQPLRIKLIDHLERNPNATVHELTELVEATQQNVSQHLVILHQAGILARHKDGTHVRYELIDPDVIALIEGAAASVARQLGELSRLVSPNPDESTA